MFSPFPATSVYGWIFFAKFNQITDKSWMQKQILDSNYLLLSHMLKRFAKIKNNASLLTTFV